MNQVIFVKAYIIHQDSILVLYRDEKVKYRPNTYDLPGGTVEFGEHPDDAIIREIKEEVGIIIKKTSLYLSHISSYIVATDTQAIGINYFTRTADNHVSLSHEHSTFSWQKISSVRINEKIPEWIRHPIQKINSMIENT